MSEPLHITPVLRAPMGLGGYHCNEFFISSPDVRLLFGLRSLVIRLRIWPADVAPDGNGKRIRLTRNSAGIWRWSHRQHTGYFGIRPSKYISAHICDVPKSLFSWFRRNWRDVYVELEEIAEDE